MLRNDCKTPGNSEEILGTIVCLYEGRYILCMDVISFENWWSLRDQTYFEEFRFNYAHHISELLTGYIWHDCDLSGTYAAEIGIHI